MKCFYDIFENLGLAKARICSEGPFSPGKVSTKSVGLKVEYQDGF
jgi:hypothetical protein